MPVQGSQVKQPLKVRSQKWLTDAHVLLAEGAVLCKPGGQEAHGGQPAPALAASAAPAEGEKREVCVWRSEVWGSETETDYRERSHIQRQREIGMDRDMQS